jgi:hypothetical protein
MSPPQLIEPMAKYYLFDTLKVCHNTRTTIYYYALNIGVFLLFISIFGYLLYYNYTHKLSDYEKERKMIRDQQYVLSKIRFYQEEKKQNTSRISNITNLPFV